MSELKNLINYNIINANGTVQQCSDDITQPFYVPVGKGRLNLHTGQRGGYYLPALKPTTENTRAEIPQEAPDWIRKLWDTQNQLRGMVQFLYSKETERRANASKRETFTIK